MMFLYLKYGEKTLSLSKQNNRLAALYTADRKYSYNNVIYN